MSKLAKVINRISSEGGNRVIAIGGKGDKLLGYERGRLGLPERRRSGRAMRYGTDRQQSSSSDVILEVAPSCKGVGVDNFVWKKHIETLYFQIGRWMVARVNFPSLTLVTPPFQIGERLLAPTAAAFSSGCEVVACPSLPVRQDLPTLRICRHAIRYVTHRGDQYYIEFEGSFEEYLKGWSQQARYKIRRDVRRHFTRFAGGAIDWREYRSVEEISEFLTRATPISRRSKHYSRGFGLRDSEERNAALLSDAADGSLRGYLLLYRTQAIAYALCRIYGDVITYSVAGYDPDFAEHRPGAVLLYLILERLFSEKKFRIFDLTGTTYYAYKKQFSSGSIRCARVLWFRPCCRNLLLVLANYLLMTVWSGASKAKSMVDTVTYRGSRIRGRAVRLNKAADSSQQGWVG